MDDFSLGLRGFITHRKKIRAKNKVKIYTEKQRRRSTTVWKSTSTALNIHLESENRSRRSTSGRVIF